MACHTCTFLSADSRQWGIAGLPLVVLFLNGRREHERAAPIGTDGDVSIEVPIRVRTIPRGGQRSHAISFRSELLLFSGCGNSLFYDSLLQAATDDRDRLGNVHTIGPRSAAKK